MHGELFQMLMEQKPHWDANNIGGIIITLFGDVHKYLSLLNANSIGGIIIFIF